MGTRAITEFGRYTGCGGPEYDGRTLQSVYVPMGDGTGLAVDIYTPTRGGGAADPLPVILHYTPYGRRAYTGQVVDGGRESRLSEPIGLLPLTGYGYVLAVAEVRGTGASFGVRRVVNSRREAEDGAELVRWLAAQPFCSGVVGTVGQSYHGQTQLEIISRRPPALRAAFIGHTDFNRYDGWVRGGVPRAFGSDPDFPWAEDEAGRERQVDELVERTVPVDCDPDRRLLRQAIRQHMDNGSQVAMQRELDCRDDDDGRYGGQVWHALSASTYLSEINASGVAIYLTGGLFDVFRRDTFVLNQNLTVPHRLAVGPWYHVGKKEDPAWLPEVHRWFDYWLKGVENGVMEEPPLILRVASFDFAGDRHFGEGTGEYRGEDAWPRHPVRADTLYLTPGGLAAESPGEGELTYRAQYGVATSCEDRTTTRSDGRGVDQLGQVFTSPPVEEPYVITGHPVARITFSLAPDCGVEDVDFFALLSDYDPERDRAFPFSDGRLRASMRGTAEPPYDFLGLPWHPCRRASRMPLTPGRRYTLEIDLMPVSYRIPVGHCLRLSLANAQDRCYYLGREAWERDAETQGPLITLHLGGTEGCRVELPDGYSDRR